MAFRRSMDGIEAADTIEEDGYEGEVDCEFYFGRCWVSGGNFCRNFSHSLFIFNKKSFEEATNLRQRQPPYPTHVRDIDSRLP